MRSAAADVNLTENEAELRNIVLQSDAMQMTGDARVNLESREFAFNLKGSEVKLENLRSLAGSSVAIGGQADFEVNGQGTPDAPVVNGRVRLRNLAVGGHPLGGMDVEAVTHGSEMTLTARSSFRTGEARLDGQIHLRGAMPMHLTGELHSTDLNSTLNAYLPVRLSGPSQADIRMDAHGEALHLSDMTAEMEVDRLATSLRGSRGGQRGTDPSANGARDRARRSVPPGGRAGNTLCAGARTGAVERQARDRFARRRQREPEAVGDCESEPDGERHGQSRSAGRRNPGPALAARTPERAGATLNYTDFPNGLSDINGLLVFNEDRLQLQNLTARTGGGLLHCSGFITYLPSQGLGFNLSATGHEIRLRYPEGLSSTADASFSLSGNLKNVLLTGDISVTRLAINPQFDLANYLAKSMIPAPALQIDSPLNHLRLDVHVSSTPELQLQTALARLRGNIDLRLRGSALRPVVLRPRQPGGRHGGIQRHQVPAGARRDRLHAIPCA